MLSSWTSWQLPTTAGLITRWRAVVMAAEGKGACAPTTEMQSCSNPVFATETVCAAWIGPTLAATAPPDSAANASAVGKGNSPVPDGPGFVWEWWIILAVAGAGTAVLLLVLVSLLVAYKRRQTKQAQLTPMTPTGPKVDAALTGCVCCHAAHQAPTPGPGLHIPHPPPLLFLPLPPPLSSAIHPHAHTRCAGWLANI